MSYLAKTSYHKGESPKDYFKNRHKGIYGQYIYNKEIQEVKKILSKIDSNSVFLDLPCGNGRWWKMLYKKTKKIIACDISPGMLKYASQWKTKNKFKKILLLNVDAENLPFSENFFDYSFCFALTKHLPKNIQIKVLGQLNKVSKKGIICTFPIVNFYTNIIYKLRSKKLQKELKPMFLNELQIYLKKMDLVIIYYSRISSFLGVEHIFLLQPKKKFK